MSDDGEKTEEIPRRYLIKLKSGEEHTTREKFDSYDDLLRWINTRAAGILYHTKHVKFQPEDIESIHPIQE